MRALNIVLAFAALAVTFLFLDRLTRPAGHPRPAPTSAETLGIAEALAGRSGLAVEGIVLGRASGGEHDFRGLHTADGRMRPVYGRVRVVCNGQAVGPACWEISYLEIDGQQVAHRITALGSHAEPPDEGGDAEIETADAAGAVDPIAAIPAAPSDAGAAGAAAPARIVARTPDSPSAPGMRGKAPTGAVPVPAARRSPGRPDRPGRTPPGDGHATRAADAATNGADPARAPTHAVDRPVINARNGPGTDTPVIARLPEGMRLSLIDRQDDWGRFVVLDGAASGREVWAALRILKRLP